MYCTKCGTRNDDSSTTCIQCGNALRPASFGTPLEPTAPAVPPPPAALPPQAPPPQQYQAPIAQAYTPPPVAGAPVVVPNYLVQAILVTFFCCLPFGIVSIIFASQVNTKLAVGDIAGAMESSRQAKLFAWIGFGVSAFAITCYLIFMMLVFMGAIASGTHIH